MNSRSLLGKYDQSEEKSGNLRSCGCARRYFPSPPLGSPPINGPGRSRSSTGSSGGGESRSTGMKPRSRASYNLSSGRSTPSPTRGSRPGMGDRTVSESALHDLQEPVAPVHQRFVSTFHLKPRSLSAQYTTTVLIRVGSSQRHQIEEIKYELRLTPNKPPINKSETEGNKKQTTEKHKSRRFKTEFEVELQEPDTTLIKIHQPSVIIDNDDRMGKNNTREQADRDTADAHLP